VTAAGEASQAEVRAARTGAALFRREDAGLVEVTGADRVRWLDGMLSNDVTVLEAGPVRSGCPALLLTRTGRIVADPHVLWRPDAFWLALARTAVPAVIETLGRFLVADRVELHDRSDAWERFALEGPDAPALVDGLAGSPLGLAPDAAVEAALGGTRTGVAAFGATPGGRQLFVPAGSGEAVAAALVGAGAQPAGPEALEILRIEAGQPRLYADLDETVLPAEVGLDAAISTTKGCYTGQEIVARMASQGRAKHRLVGLALAGESSPAPGEAIRDAEGAVGEITSACLSPVFGAIALGFVGAARAAPGTCLEVAGHPARVAALPFAAAAR